MEHLYLFCLFFTFSIGFISFGIIVFLYVKTKEAVLRYYLYFYISFSLLSASVVWLTYIYINISWINADSLEFVAEIFATLVMFTTPLFLHFLLTDPHAKLKNVIFGGIALWIATQRPVITYIIKNQTLRQIDTHVAHTLFILVFLYTVVLGLYASGKVQDQHRKTLARTFSFLLASFLPGILIDEAIENMYIPNYPPVFFPLCYAIFSIIFARHFIKLYGHHPHISTLPEASSEQVPVEELFQNYNISPREQEVIRLILQGYSNQQIGDTLFISLSTVKKHVTNIYQKLGIKSRYELITLFKDMLIDSVD